MPNSGDATSSWKMFDKRELVGAVAAAADSWMHPDYDPRQVAVEETLEAPNAFTEEAVAFAVNQQMSLLTEEALEAWIGARSASSPCTVGVLNAGNIPLVGLQDFLAVVLTGHRYLGSVSSKSPALLPAFVADLCRFAPDIAVNFSPLPELLARADALIATGSDETISWLRDGARGPAPDDTQDETTGKAHDILPARCLFRGHSFAVGVLDGKERADTYERLAEDVLLHEGFGCRNIAVMWVPRSLAPDGLLEAMARFRGVFPAHDRTAGRLAMQRALLEAVDASHAYGEGLEFLVSRGEPEVQSPGHLRWAEYDDIADVNAWLGKQPVQLIVATPQVQKRLKFGGILLAPGEAQRPALDWRPDGIDTLDFLSGL